VPSDVARDFSAASRVADHRDVLEIQGLDHGCEIVGIPIPSLCSRWSCRPSL
jgi:hypothetical protein